MSGLVLSFCFVLFSVSRDGRGTRPNSTHIVSVSVLMADETRFIPLPLSFTHTWLFPCFSYPPSLIPSRSVATRFPFGRRLIHFLTFPALSCRSSFCGSADDSYPRWRWGGSGLALSNIARLRVGLLRWVHSVHLRPCSTFKLSNLMSGYALEPRIGLQSDSRHLPKAIHRSRFVHTSL